MKSHYVFLILLVESTIAMGQKVGIGTSNPLAGLHVQSDSMNNIMALFKNGGGYNHVIIDNNSVQNEIGVNGQTGYIRTNTPHNFSIGTAGDNFVTLSEATRSLGIGMTEPAARLHVKSGPLPGDEIGMFESYQPNGTGQVKISNGSVILHSGINSQKGFMGTSSPHDVMITSGGTDRIYVQHATGNIGIGTQNPNKRLTIRADANQDVLQFSNSNDQPEWHWWMPNGNLVLSESGFADYRFTIRAGYGYVGIGTNDPAYALHVLNPFATFTISKFQSIASDADIIVASQNKQIKLGVDFEGGYIGTPISGDFNLRTGSTTKMTIKYPSGYVGIGTSNPAKKLHVAGDVQVDQGATFNADVTIAGALNVGSIAPAPITYVTAFQNGFSNYGAPFDGASYYKDKESRVFLGGQVNIPTNGSGIIFTLPVGFRPQYQCVFLVMEAGGGTARVDINAGGQVILEPGNSGHISLNNISFRAYP